MEVEDEPPPAGFEAIAGVVELYTAMERAQGNLDAAARALGFDGARDLDPPAVLGAAILEAELAELEHRADVERAREQRERARTAS